MKASASPKICFISGEIFGVTAVGGGERQMSLLREGLKGRGVLVDVVARELSGSTDSAVPHSDRVFRFRGEPGFRLQWVDSITCAAVQSDADIYYQRGMSVFTIAAARAASVRRVSFIWGASSDADCDGVMGRLKRAFTQRRGVMHQGAVRAAVGSCVEAYLHARAYHAVRYADIVVAQTAHQSMMLRASLGPRAHIEVCNSFGPPVLEPGHAERDKVLWVGSDKPVKRPELFLDLARRGPAAVQYMMVGKDLDPGWAHLAPVALRPPATPQELNEEYASSLCLVSTSSVEGFPNTFLEAWACGTPVVSIGIDPDGVIARYGLGWVCRDVREAVSVLECLSADLAVLQKLGERCRNYVLAKHSTDEVLDRYMWLLEGLSERVGGAS